MDKLIKQGKEYIWTAEMINNIIVLYSSGQSTTEIATKYNVNVKTIVKILKEQKIVLKPHRYRCYVFNERFFETIDTEEKAYWLGFLVADGCVAKDRGRITLALAEIDKEHIEKFQLSINSKINISNNNKTNSCRLVLNSKLMKNDLINMGCVDNKSYKDIQLPILNTVELYRHFLRGIFDGDGCITFDVSKNRYKVGFLGSPKLINFINEFLCLMLGINKVKITSDARFKSDFTRSVTWSGKQNVLSILAFLYNDATIKLNRKYNKYLQIDVSDIRSRRKTGLYLVAPNNKQIILDDKYDLQVLKEGRTEEGKLSRKLIREETGKDSTFRSKNHKAYFGKEGTKSNTLTTSLGAEGLIINKSINDYNIRKLTPKECERLQTFPDDYNKYGLFMNNKSNEWEKKEISDSQRFKQLGNSFTVEVIKHILKYL
jgi:C-5 cytosine-specific DNA methylase